MVVFGVLATVSLLKIPQVIIFVFDMQLIIRNMGKNYQNITKNLGLLIDKLVLCVVLDHISRQKMS